MSKLAAFGLVVAFGFLCNLWLQKSCPWSVNGIIKGITLWTVSALVYSAEDADFSQTISTGLTLVPPLTALGFMLG